MRRLVEVHELLVGYPSVLASILIRGCVQEQFLQLCYRLFAGLHALKLEVSSGSSPFSGVIGDATTTSK